MGDDLCLDLFISERHEGVEIDEAPEGKEIHRTGVREPGTLIQSSSYSGLNVAMIVWQSLLSIFFYILQPENAYKFV